MFLKRIKLVRQIAERHANDGNDDVGERCPYTQHLNKEFQTEIIQKNITDSHHQIPDHLRSAFQRGAREADVARHPEAGKEGDGKLEHKCRDVGRESQVGNVSVEKELAKVKNLLMENVIVKDIVQYPLQNKVHTTAGCIAEQFEAHDLAERRIEEVDELRQSTFHPGFYVAEG